MNCNPLEVLYRKATIADAASLRTIMEYFISNTTASWRYQPMDLKSYQMWIEAHKTPDRPFWVAEADHEVVGYSCLSDFRNIEGYWPCAENSVYVKPEYHGKGIGRKLMQLILDDGSQAGLRAVIAVIDSENISSIKFHQQFGFYQCGLMKNIGWKRNSWRSVVFLQCDMNQERPDPDCDIEQKILEKK